MAHIVGAKRYERSDGKADTQVQHEHERNADHGGVEPSLPECGGAEATRGESEHAGIERDMPNVEWQTKELRNRRREAQQITERDAGTPGADVAVDPVGNLLHSSDANSLPKGVLRNRGRNAMVDGEVFTPPSGEAGKPEQDAGERCVNGGCRGQRTQRQIDVLCLLSLQVG